MATKRVKKRVSAMELRTSDDSRKSCTLRKYKPISAQPTNSMGPKASRAGGAESRANTKHLRVVIVVIVAGGECEK